MKKMIYNTRRFVSKILPRIITDLIKYLLRCLLDSVQDVEFIV